MKTIIHGDFNLSIEKYSFTDTYDVWNYYICTISNSDDRYYMVFSADGLSEDAAFKQCIRRLVYKNECSVKFTVKNIYKFIDKYREEIDKLNRNYDVEIRED